MNIVEIAGWLNQSGVSAAPCPWLPAISIFVDEHYENYDYDMIGPKERRQISRALLDREFRQVGGRVFEGPLGRIEFPRPTRTLATDPVEELERVLDRGAGSVFATPTQVLLTTWRQEGPRLTSARQAALIELVREQPANLDKVRDWLRRTECATDFARCRPQLAAAQQEGFELRRTGRFRSRLPRSEESET